MRVEREREWDENCEQNVGANWRIESTIWWRKKIDALKSSNGFFFGIDLTGKECVLNSLYYDSYIINHIEFNLESITIFDIYIAAWRCYDYGYVAPRCGKHHKNHHSIFLYRCNHRCMSFTQCMCVCACIYDLECLMIH